MSSSVVLRPFSHAERHLGGIPGSLVSVLLFFLYLSGVAPPAPRLRGAPVLTPLWSCVCFPLFLRCGFIRFEDHDTLWAHFLHFPSVLGARQTSRITFRCLGLFFFKDFFSVLLCQPSVTEQAWWQVALEGPRSQRSALQPPRVSWGGTGSQVHSHGYGQCSVPHGPRARGPPSVPRDVDSL